MTNAISRTDWARIDALTEDEIDTSDIPPLPETFFANAKWQMLSSVILKNTTARSLSQPGCCLL